MGKVKKNIGGSADRPGPGRPRLARELTRPHRIVTFVTDNEQQKLRQTAVDEDRSMAAVIHRIIKAHFEKSK